MTKLVLALAALLVLVAAPVRAEKVAIKFHRQVELGRFKCTDVANGNIVHRVCYDRPRRYMVINLRGTYYHYCEIDSGTVASLLKAQWIDDYYQSAIRGNFDCRTHRIPRY